MTQQGEKNEYETADGLRLLYGKVEEAVVDERDAWRVGNDRSGTMEFRWRPRAYILGNFTYVP